jgi:flavin reductase (DIM6/NTAB) family NADH-FMN oxidoreductase RutF
LPAGRIRKYEYVGDTPVFAHAISTIAARVTARHDCGDHSVFIGHIVTVRHSDGLSPIVLNTGKLASLTPHEKTIWPTLDFW